MKQRFGMDLKHALILCGVAAFWAVAVTTEAGASEPNISLAGKWRFALDRGDTGISERWFEDGLLGSVKLPGSLSEQGIGDDIRLETEWTGGILDRSFFTDSKFAKYRQPGRVKVPFWLQPEKYYAGVAWFQRDIEVPTGWRGRRLVLFLERPHWETRVWVDGKCIGTNNSLATPHEYDLGALAPGKHSLSIRVDNRRVIDIGENSHAISDHTQGNWNGIVGKIELRATPAVWLEDVQVYPHIATRSVTMKARIGNATGQPGRGVIQAGTKRQEARWDANGGAAELEIELGAEAKLWDEFSPTLQELTINLIPEHAATVARRVRFGLREIATEGTQFTINGRKTFIRGTLECCIFPKTGHPPTEIGEWKRIIRIAKSYGLNLLRFHSYCPPEVAFEAADELGMYFQVETCWANQSTTIGDGKPVDQWVYDETDRILKAHGNHPSFILMPYGNEPGGKNTAAYLAKYVAHYKALDSRRLWTSGSGWPQLSENQFQVTPDPRIQSWGAELKSRINACPPNTLIDYRDYIAERSVPVVSHEIGEWCVYPNFAEIPKYTGYLKPKNFEIFRDFLGQNGLGGLAGQFLLASGKLQALCYKEDIESALRTPGMGGFELLDLHDFPGQGTALVGVLDPFWDDKGYITAKEYSRFCNCTVPLARLGKRVFTTDEKLAAQIEIAHFGREPMRAAVATWKLITDEGVVCVSGEFAPKDVPLGNGIPLGSVSADLAKVKAPAHCKLVVRVAEKGSGNIPPGTFENDWDVWIYPGSAASVPTGDVLVTSRFDDAAKTCLRAGGKVLLTIPGGEVRNFDTAPVKLGFSSIFWNTAWTGRQGPTTLGILCDPKHPALAGFPCDFHSNWQWWHLIHRAGALRLDLLPRGLQPIVRVIDDWVTARPLGLVAEGGVGAGKIVVCGFDLTRDADDPVSRQMRASLLDYMSSKKFKPAVQITTEEIAHLVAEPADTRLRTIRSVKADSAQEGYPAENATDGDSNTIWHTSWVSGATDFPHELAIEFDAPRKIAGFTALPRQDGNHNGWIKDYAFYASADGKVWGEPVARGSFAANKKPQTVKLTSAVAARFVKLVALSGHADGTWASLAEFKVIEAGQ